MKRRLTAYLKAFENLEIHLETDEEGLSGGPSLIIDAFREL